MNNIYKNINLVEEAFREIERNQLKNDIPHMEQMVLLSNAEGIISDGTTEYMRRIADEINYLRARSKIEVYRQLRSVRFFGPVIILFKKIIRKMTKFYIEPITSDQSDFNAHLADTLELFGHALMKKDEEIKQLRQMLDEKR